MNPAQKLLADMKELPVGGAVLVAQLEVNTTEDVMVFRKATEATWERLRYPFTEPEGVDQATVGWEALLVGEVQLLLPKPGARLEDFSFLRRSLEKAFASVTAKSVRA